MMKRAHVEDEEDNAVEINMDIIFEDFKPPAGEPQLKAASVHSDFEHLKEKQDSLGQQPWAPFSSVEDWDYARWIMESGLSQKQIDTMLKLDIVSMHFASQDCEHCDSLKLS